MKVLQSALKVLFYSLAVTFGFVVSAFSQSVWINEISYDPIGTDTSEYVEIAGETGTDLSNYKLFFYNGNDSISYTSKSLSGTLSGNDKYSFKAFYFKSIIQNGPSDAIALVYNGSTVLQFLSYEGVITAKTGVAAGLTSKDVGVVQANSTQTIQASTLNLSNMGYQLANPTPDLVNEAQKGLVTSSKDKMFESSVMYQSDNELFFDEQYAVSVYNIIGNVIVNKTTNQLKINQPGMYIVLVKDTESRVVLNKKILIR